jgi:hypothetical protein
MLGEREIRLYGIIPSPHKTPWNHTCGNQSARDITQFVVCAKLKTNTMVVYLWHKEKKKNNIQ